MVSHIVIDGPWHYLEKSAVERRRQTSSVGGTGTGWMEVIHVDARPHDLNKLFKRVTPFRTSSFVRCQIARDDVWKWTWPGEGTKIPAATQVGRRVDLRRLAKVWVAAWSEFGIRAGAVATIAVALCVDNVAAQSHQCPVFSIQIQRYRCYFEALSNLRCFVFPIVLTRGLSMPGVIKIPIRTTSARVADDPIVLRNWRCLI